MWAPAAPCAAWAVWWHAMAGQVLVARPVATRCRPAARCSNMRRPGRMFAGLTAPWMEQALRMAQSGGSRDERGLCAAQACGPHLWVEGALASSVRVVQPLMAQERPRRGPSVVLARLHVAARALLVRCKAELNRRDDSRVRHPASHMHGGGGGGVHAAAFHSFLRGHQACWFIAACFFCDGCARSLSG